MGNKLEFKIFVRERYYMFRNDLNILCCLGANDMYF